MSNDEKPNQGSVYDYDPSLAAAILFAVLFGLSSFVHSYEIGKWKTCPIIWLTTIFVTGDVISILVQAIGGSRVGAADTKQDHDLGNTIIVVGLFIQLVMFGFFIVVTALFHRRITQRPTVQSEVVGVPWRRYLRILYGVSALVMTRSVFRVIEFLGGDDGAIMTHEVYFYVLDTMLMFFVAVVFNVFHPSSIIASRGNDETEIPLSNTAYVAMAGA